MFGFVGISVRRVCVVEFWSLGVVWVFLGCGCLVVVEEWGLCYWELECFVGGSGIYFVL